jgi:AraC-like DNA-binding protein
MNPKRAQGRNPRPQQEQAEDAPAPDPRMLAAMAFLRREFRRRPALSQIARVAHLSPFHFHRSFRRCFGKTPKQCMIDLQIAEVQRLILDGMSLRDAAARVGFTQQSHLTTRFKKVTGYTPTAWLLLTRARRANVIGP